MGTSVLCCKPDNSEGHIKNKNRIIENRGTGKLTRSRTIKRTGDFHVVRNLLVTKKFKDIKDEYDLDMKRN